MKNFLLFLFGIFLTVGSISAQRSVISQMRTKRPVPDTTAHYYIFNIPENEDYDYFVGKLNRPTIAIKDELDGNLFRLQNDSLFTAYSFDYEGPLGGKFTVLLDIGGSTDTAFINLTNLTGKWDANGIADIDIANKYPEVNVGDYIFWNYTSGNDLNGNLPGMSFPNKVLIHNKTYNQISLGLTGASGNDTASRIVVTNFLGQVECAGGLELSNPSFIRLTGQYDQASGFGHRYFTGCDRAGSKVNFGYSHGTYGIFLNNSWASTTTNALTIQTDNTGLEVDHLEIANGFFSGILWRWENNYSISDFNSIHHNFIHDVEAEGINLGSPKSFPQQLFQNTLIENNAVVRAGGEGIQVTWLMSGSRVRNNFVHAALDWKSPFARWQDNAMQIAVLGGNIRIENNILIGAGEAVANIWTKVNNTPVNYGVDSLHISHNLIYGTRGDIGFYEQPETDGLTQMVFDGNIFGKVGYDLDEVYTYADTTSTTAYSLHNKTVTNVVRNTRYDASVENLLGGAATPVTSNNQLSSVVAPNFTDYLALGQNFQYLKVSRYTDFIGMETKFPASGTHKGSPASWETGDVVQWKNASGETRLYQCAAPENTGSVPPPQDDSNNANWSLLSWIKPDGSVSYFPPDDIRLVAGSYYDQQEMGVRENINGGTPPPPPGGNLLPSIAITSISNNDTVPQATMVYIETVASDPDGTVDSVRFSVDGKTIGWDYNAPFEAPYLAAMAGSFTLRATAYDNAGDSLVSNGVTIHVSDKDFFKILHYTETSGYDHGTRAQSLAMLQQLGLTYGFEVVDDQNGNHFDDLDTLQEFAVVIFSNTSGDQILNAAQRNNFESYMSNQGSFIGIHAASDSYRHSTANGSNTGTWDWFAEMLGASVQNSPNHTTAGFAGTLNKIGTHPTTASLPNPWSKADEYYYWENGYTNPANIPVLEVQSTGSQTYDDARPMAWFKYLPGGGRSFYTALGHDGNDFASDPDFENHIRDAIFWSVNNQIPLMAITAPSVGDTIIKGSSLKLTATAFDPDGSVDSVEFRIGSQIIGRDYSAPWLFNYSATQQGNLTATAVGYDNDGGMGVSNAVNFYVKDTATAGDTIILAGNTINENYPAGSYIGTLSGSSSFRVNHESYDGWFFMTKGDSLVSRMAFDYDAFIGNKLSNSNPKVEIVNANGTKKVFTVTIIPASGKFDENGYADQDIVDKYEALGDSSLRVGDYLMFNWSNNGGQYFGEYPIVSYPNQIKIMSGFWKTLSINLDKASGINTKKPVIVTNWLGQVEYREKLSIIKCNACRLTGEYNAVKKTGNKYFNPSIHDPFKYRRYGIFRDAKSTQNNSGIATLGSGMTKIEVDHLEVMGGGYDGLNFKDDNAGGGIVDSCRVHDNYVHDIKNEGLYMGNTKSISTHGPQQHFTNVIVENNLFVRCGSEGYQFQRGIANNLYRNNVIWSGMVWLMPFQNNQFSNQQAAWTNGGHMHRDEIFMGGTGANSTLFKPRLGEVPSYSSNTNSVKNSLYYCLRGSAGFYMNGGNNGFAPTNIDSIYIGHTRLNYPIINRMWDPKKTTNAIFIENWSSPISIGYVFYDFTVTNATNSHTPAKHPIQQSVPAPQFENVFGTSTGSLQVDSIHRWSRWTDIIWGNTSNGAYLRSIGFNVGDHMVFKPHDVVQHWAAKADRWGGSANPVRLYYCIKQHDATQVEPGVTPGWENYWQVLTWTKPDGTLTFFPPDDFDLVQGSYYDVRGMGLR